MTLYQIFYRLHNGTLIQAEPGRFYKSKGVAELVMESLQAKYHSLYFEIHAGEESVDGMPTPQSEKDS